MSVDDIQRDRISAARDFAEKYGVNVVLKGANTVIASPKGSIFVNICGNSGLAKGGSGDVLTGMIAAMTAQGIDPLKAAVSGVYCHAIASDILLKSIPAESMLPGDIINILPEVYRS
ncbi:MAG: NAD(P)H-hydrate dehydratase [Oscillospiraceae bacterium]|nr:NAD(P)H-hydrate dehydratase [Oscillospiraceae bacterium]